ncbi:PepSY domain-containing protein [Marinomonas ostreistagni]|uniref:PepSY domain-containing protein n=1 Tax=Marinomonas ostreistagni TaxID=359209 RepID=UPI0019505C3D|nr:PepSY domain-containing protein [Marinomonas ostreistagni]MBM6551817.1 PepSY domain-containing protein [Marinomonas ostreistagni]
MKKLTLPALIAITFAGSALAGPTCTEADRSTWMSQDALKQQLVDQGYQIKKFKVTDKNCYEIYGYDQADRRVEIYFNPVNGEAVKTEIDD